MKDHAEDQASPFSSRWEKTCALFDPTISIRRHAIVSPDGAKRVWFRRDWRNYDNGAAVWTKEYDKLGYDLRSFNTAERDILQTLKLLPNCYQLVENYDKTSKLAPLDPKAQRSGSYIAMTDMGPTVYDWLAWPVRIGVERRRLDNLFALPGNFIRLALAGLRSLGDIHDKNFVHLDYRLPNVCLAPRGRSIPCKDREGDYLKIQLDWHTLKTIDFGFSIARGKTPYTLLPPLEAATPAARALIDEVEEIGRDKFNSLMPTERNALKASDFSDVQHNHTFWTSHCPGALDHLRAIDWREDCYQFGKQLQYIRDQAGLMDFLDENAYLKNVGGVTFAIRELPEQLIALGQSVVAYPALGSPEAAELEQQRKDTYRRLIRQLEIAIRDMPPDWSTDEVLIFRSDIEPHTETEPRHTAVRPPAPWLRKVPWKKAAIAVAGSTALFAVLPSLQAWTKSMSAPPLVAEADLPAQPSAEPARPAPSPPAKPQPTPEELAARRAAEEAAKAAQIKAAALAAWRKEAAKIEQTPWWRNNTGKPTAAQLAWVRETQRLAKEYGELDTLIDLAALPCTGRAAPLIARSSTECGRHLTAVLQHADFAPDKQQGLLKQIIAILDARVYNHQPAQADTAFAIAILPGLTALGGQLAPFAFHASYIQGCVQQPMQLAAAGKQLETLLERWPNSGTAREARRLEWPARLQRGDNLCVNP